MSGSDKPNAEKSESVSTFYSRFQTSLDKIPKSSESQPIIINFYSSNNTQKLDKLIQTECAVNNFKKTPPKVQEIVVKRREASTSTGSERDSEDSEDEYSLVSRNGSARFVSHEKKTIRLMESRKQLSDNKSNKSGINSRTTSDLERKKLEAELKAAEEIAKLKESIIEKRLAFELASIQNGDEHQQKMARSSSPHSDLRAFEENAMKKQALIESNLSQELEALEFQNRVHASRQAPPPPLSLGPSRQPPSSAKPNSFRTDSSSSVLNSIRNVTQFDRKFNLDKQHSGPVEYRSSSPTNFFTSNDPRYTDPRYRNDDRHPVYSRQDPSYYSPGAQTSHAHSIWRAALAKIKKKIKLSKATPEEWRPYPDEEPRRK